MLRYYKDNYPPKNGLTRNTILIRRHNEPDVIERIKIKLASEINLIHKMTDYHVKSGGKRIRPLLTLVSAKLCGYKNGSREEQSVLVSAVSVNDALTQDVGVSGVFILDLSASDYVEVYSRHVSDGGGAQNYDVLYENIDFC